MMMNTCDRTANLSRLMAEDAGAPELRDPVHSAVRATGWLARLAALLHK